MIAQAPSSTVKPPLHMCRGMLRCPYESAPSREIHGHLLPLGNDAKNNALRQFAGVFPERKGVRERLYHPSLRLP
ncbi:hypothetical protein GCM10023205_11970 [Yinghuangia aomiensis]|uniref:Uncharacterized protein n=1 Tax=Yinghuangia aomiensis TaxID=676205 RepID=A0ABP9GV40_9ACTN